MDNNQLHQAATNSVPDKIKRYVTKHSWQLIIFGTIHVVIFFFLFRSLVYSRLIPGYFGFIEFWQYASNVGHHLLPYKDFAVEYPPLGIAFVTWPGLVTSNPDVYYGIYVAETLLCDLAGLFIITGLTKQLKLKLWQTLTVYTLSLLAIGRIISIRYDIFPSIITILAIYIFIKGKYKIAWALIAIGTFTKLYPIVIVPIFLLYHLFHNTKREIISGIITFILVSAAIVVPAILLSPSGFLNSFTYQTGRGLQLESTYASILLVLKTFGLTSLAIDSTSGAFGVTSSLANILAEISPLLICFSLIATYWLFYREQKGNIATKSKFGALNLSDATLIVKYSFLAILVLIITNKVLSPQYLIWLYPFIPVLVTQRKIKPWMVFIVIGILTYLIYPVFYEALMNEEYFAVGLLLARNILLIVPAFLVISDSRRLTYRQANINSH